jgi:hypothetical protein
MKSPEFKNRWTEHLIHSKWEGWVGEKIAQHIIPHRFTDGHLIVYIDDEKWIKPFEEFKDKIHEKIKNDLGPQSIKTLSIAMDQKKSAKKGHKKKKTLKPSRKEIVEKTSTTMNQSLSNDMEEALITIKDPAVRTALRQLIIKAVASNQNGS